MGSWRRYWRIARVWRVVVLSLSLVVLAVGIARWAFTGDFYQSMSLIVSPLLGITATAVAVHYVFSVNIFGKMRKSPSPSGRLFVFVCALGLYLSVVAAIFFVTSFLLLWILQIPRTIVLTMVVLELALFSVVGYTGLTRLRRNIQLLSNALDL